MNLIIFPGGGSPTNEMYRKVYDLLAGAATNYGYQNIDTSITYPGHADNDGKSSGKLTLDGAIGMAISSVQEYETKGLQYDFLGRSFGTIVATKIATDRKLKYLRKVILWGPPPYWLIWQMFVRDLKENIKIANEKGLHVDATFFPSLEPLESMLPLLEHRTVVATGTKDPHSKPIYINYLSNCVVHKFNFLFRIVENAPHEVTRENCTPEIVSSYEEALFT